MGAGLENIDCEYAASKGIKLISAPEGNRQAVGEHAVGMLLALMRNILVADSEVRHGKWIREGNRGYEINGRTVGIIGYGNMGGSFARCVSGFGPEEVLAYDIKPGDYSDDYARRATMDELFEKADIVSLHVPLTNLTRGMINGEFFSRFKKPIYFINTARGACCVTEDLVTAIREGRVTGAALDVLNYERFLHRYVTRCVYVSHRFPQGGTYSAHRRLDARGKPQNGGGYRPENRGIVIDV